MGQSVSKVVVIDQNADRAQVLVDGLHEAGIADVVLIKDGLDILNRITTFTPDIILIDLENPRRDTVEQMLRVSEQVERPVVMFADESEPELTRRVIQSGVSAYIVDGLHENRLRSIIEIAVARFERFADMGKKVAKLQQQLDDRKVVEKAKGILMRTRSMSEDEAHALLRRSAMNEKKKISEIADIVIAASKIGL
ncbi:ANTAR domain-containing response regulator [Bauldia sp.]|uniref:ANTAR domain-containing response regulator n=1 Tax=Bauldia sp. TaxID=2575872 RepID=UPI003BAC7970